MTETCIPKPKTQTWTGEISEIPLETIQAYCAAHYKVLTSKPFTLRVGAVCGQLAELLTSEKASSAAFITAWNPFSQVASRADNSASQQSLSVDVTSLGLMSLPGVGQDPAEFWPGEDSFLVLGPTLEQACALGIKYGQNAILWIGSDSCPELVLLR